MCLISVNGDHSMKTPLKLLAVFVSFTAVFVVAYAILNSGVTQPHLMSWILIFVFSSFMVGLAGKMTEQDRWTAVITSERNRFSLGRLQFMTWTIIIFSCYCHCLLSNFAIDGITIESAVNVNIPDQVLLILGINTGSALLGSAVISAQKPQSDKDKIAFRVPTDSDPDPKPDISDLFTGETVGKRSNIIVSRLQALLFTLGISIIYVGSYLKTITAEEGSLIESLPMISQSMVLLMGISQTAYVSAKAVPTDKA